MQSPEKSTLWFICIKLNNFFVYGPKCTNFFSSNVGWVVVDKILFLFSTCGCVPEIFAIKVESCQKSRRILDGFFDLPNFLGRAFQNCTQFITPALRHVDWKKFREDTPSNPEVIELNTLNFRPNFEFSQLKFFGGPPFPLGCALASLDQSVARVKNLRGQHPLRAEMQSPEKSTLLSIYITLNNFFVCGPKFTVFFSANVGGAVVNKLLFRFSICESVPEIFAIKVESCQKSRRILDGFFALPNFQGRAQQKLHPVYHSCLTARRLKKFHEDTPTSPEVIEPIGDRPRELGDLAAKKKKHHEHFIRPPVTPYGRPNNASIKHQTVNKAYNIQRHINSKNKRGTN